MSLGRARIGCSGWQYRSWRGRFYPADLPARRWFEYYAQHFDTVELNSTFYRLPAESAVAAWAKTAPVDFVYAVKLGAFGSHRMKLRDPEGWVANHVARFVRLGSALGPTLVQLPPRWRRDVARLDDFLHAFPATWRCAVEVRDASWLCDPVFAVLGAHDAALCIHDLLPQHPWVRTASWAYLRFHGPAALDAPYAGRYTGRRLWRIADRIEDWLDQGCDVFGYFNNDTDANAVRDATWLRARLVQRRG